MSLMFLYLEFKILDFFCDNDILLHLVSTVLEAKYEIYIENIRKKNVRITLRGVIPKAFCFKSLEPLATTMLGAFTNLEVKQFQGKTVSTMFFINPNVPELELFKTMEMQREGVPSKFSGNTKENEAIQINGIQSVRNSMKNEKGAVVDQKEQQKGRYTHESQPPCIGVKKIVHGQR
ncbi:hypothetical protein ACFX11_033432 [Malus domestica]